MTKRSGTKTFAAAVLAGILGLSGVALAGPRHGKSPEERIAHIERRVKERLAPRLGLDERTAAQLTEILRNAAQQRMAAHERVRTEREALQALVERKASAGELDAQMKRLGEARAALPERGAVLEQTRRILSAEQQAQLTLLLSKGGHHGRRGEHGPRGAHGPRGDKT